MTSHSDRLVRSYVKLILGIYDKLPSNTGTGSLYQNHIPSPDTRIPWGPWDRHLSEDVLTDMTEKMVRELRRCEDR